MQATRSLAQHGYLEENGSYSIRVLVAAVPRRCALMGRTCVTRWWPLGWAANGTSLAWIADPKHPQLPHPPFTIGFAILRRGQAPRHFRFHGGLRGVRCDLSTGPRLSPDGNLVVYPDRTHGHIEWYIVSTRRRQRPQPLTPTNIHLESPVWSPNSRAVAFTTGPDQSDAFVLSAKQPRLRLLARGVTNLAWSPDGRELVVSRGHNDLVLVDARGTVIKRLVESRYGAIFDVSWAPARTIAYIENIGDSTQDKCQD